MKAHTRWLACGTCGVLGDHVLDATGRTPLDAAHGIETWVCTICGSGHPVAPNHSDQADREKLERYGQLRLID